jgi:hypothetical protein
MPRTKLNPSESYIGEAGGPSITIIPAITVDTNAYAAGDNIGGKLTLAGAARVAGRGTMLTDIHILDRSNQKAALEILIFASDPTAATITDQAGFVYSTDDLKQIARISVAAADYVTINGKATVHLRNLATVLHPTTTSLFVAIVTTGTPTYAASALQVVFKFLQL